MHIVECTPDHVRRLRVQPEQAHIQARLIAEADSVGRHGVTVAWVDGDEVLGCAGMVQAEPPIAWAILSEMGPRRFLKVHRHLLRILNARNEHCLMHVDEGFENGHRWAELLGFKRNKTLEKERGIRCYERHKN